MVVLANAILPKRTSFSYRGMISALDLVQSAVLDAKGGTAFVAVSAAEEECLHNLASFRQEVWHYAPLHGEAQVLIGTTVDFGHGVVEGWCSRGMV